MTDVEVAIRLGREPSDHHGAALGIKIGLDDIANEVAPALRDAIAAHCRLTDRHALTSGPVPR